MIVKLEELDPRIARDLEEELCDPYETTLIRLAKAGIAVEESFRKMGRRIFPIGSL
jgi:hypothetical protein